MQPRTIHIIGAGLAGLSAATRLIECGEQVIVHESSAQAGGRCRSYYDSALDMTIDNGNHLLLSGNQAALRYLTRIGTAADFLQNNHTKQAEFHFIDAASMARWQIRMNQGIIPWWLFDPSRRVPDTSLRDYLSLLYLSRAKKSQTVTALLDKHTILYKRLWQLFLVSALNTHPDEASAFLAGAVIRGSLLKGGKACIPLVADGLSAMFIDPAITFIENQGGKLCLNQRIRHIEYTADRASRLDTSVGEPITLGAHDVVLYAAPAQSASVLLPGITTPEQTRGIVNAHFAIAPPANFPRILGVINAQTEWIFSFENRISITISDAERLMDNDRQALAELLWAEVSSITGLAKSLPRWQIVKEKRATFAATPAQDSKRPDTKTPWHNVFLAGDWVQTGLPATIEGAIRSGYRAAQAILDKRSCKLLLKKH